MIQNGDINLPWDRYEWVNELRWKGWVLSWVVYEWWAGELYKPTSKCNEFHSSLTGWYLLPKPANEYLSPWAVGEEDEIKPLWMGCFHKTIGGKETDQPSDGENPGSTNFRYFRPICDPYHSIISNITFVSARSARTIPIKESGRALEALPSGVWGGAPAENNFSKFI